MVTAFLVGYKSISTNTNAASCSAIHSWPQELGDSLHMRVVQHGFSGTGLTTPSNGVPVTIENNFYYAKGVPINLHEDIKINFINIGTNDANANITHVCALYDTLIQKKKLWFKDAKL